MKRLFGVFVMLTAFAAAPAWAAPLQADWFIANGSLGLNFHFTMEVEQTGANYDVRFTAANEGTQSGYYRGFGVKNLFDDNLTGVGTDWFSATLFSGSSETDLTVFRGGLNLKTSQSDYCKDGANGHEGMVCSELEVAGTDVRLASGESILFQFLVTGANLQTNYWHLQTKVFESPSGNGALGSISADAEPRTPPTEVPEPGTLMMFGVALTPFLPSLRRRRREA